MGNSLSDFLRRFPLSWSNWNAVEALDAEEEKRRKDLEDVIVKAVNEGDLDVLVRVHEESRCICWSSFESLNSKSPLLHKAASKDHANIVQFLLDLGMEVDETDSSGMTALHVACQCKVRHNSCVPLLLARCRDLNKRDVWGRSPLMKALVHRNSYAAKTLLERGANPNATDIYGMTPLSTAIAYNQMDMLHCLVSHGADVNLITRHPCRYSGPPLYLAIHNQNLAMTQELLSLGANTQPRFKDFRRQHHHNGPSYSSSSLSSSPCILPHANAVSLAMSEFMRRGEDEAADSSSSACMDILMAVLAAHGNSLGSSPDVLIRVLVNSGPRDFRLLLHKLQVCSSCCSEEMAAALLLSPPHSHSQQAESRSSSSSKAADLQQLSQQFRRPPLRLVSSLQNQARRAARRALMASSRNVAWACHRLQCPPALKTLILLKDIDRAFTPSEHLFPFAGGKGGGGADSKPATLSSSSFRDEDVSTQSS